MSPLDRLLWMAAVVWSLILTITSLGPAPEVLDQIPWFDKVLHLTGYLVLTGLLLLAAVWRPGRGLGPLSDRAWVVLLVAEGVGLSLELAQAAIVTRNSNLWDALANTLGVFLALGLWTAFRKWSESGQGEQRG